MKKKNRSWLKLKSYCHFSKKLSHTDRSFIISYVRNATSVANHKFYPLIRRDIRSRRFKLVEDYDKGITIKAHSFINENLERESTAKVRKIFYADHLDSLIYSYYAKEVLGKAYEAKLKDNNELSAAVIAYRGIPLKGTKRNHNNIDFANEVFSKIKSKLKIDSECVAIAFDIKEFFDSLDYSVLKQAWCETIGQMTLPPDHYNIFRSLTKCSYVTLSSLLKEFNISNIRELHKGNIHHFTHSYSEFRAKVTKKNLIKKHPFHREVNGKKYCVGIPQGTPISALLANIYLMAFDKEVLDYIRPHGGFYRRYSDDLIVVCSKDNSDNIRRFITEKINNDYKLIIQDTKTQLTRYIKVGNDIEYYTIDNDIIKKRPLQYLGFEFDGNRARIKAASLSKFYRSMKRLIRIKAKKASIEKVNYGKKKAADTQPTGIHKGVIYKRFSHLGKHGKNRNYYIYARDATRIFKDDTAKRQLKRSWQILNGYLDKYESKYRLKPVHQIKEEDSSQSLNEQEPALTLPTFVA